MTTVFVITLFRSDPEYVVFFSCLLSASPRLTTFFLLKVKKNFNSLSSDSFTVWRAPSLCVYFPAHSSRKDLTVLFL